jgi:hypothetical protein
MGANRINGLWEICKTVAADDRRNSHRSIGFGTLQCPGFRWGEVMFRIAEALGAAAKNPMIVKWLRVIIDDVEASCVFHVLMRYEVKQHDFKMFEGDP